MAISSTAAGRVPALFAYGAAGVLVLSSGAINVQYGIKKATDLPGQITWGAVAAAVAIVLALSWPALIRSLHNRDFGAAAVALIALLLSGSYSVTAALGSASGGRTDAAVAEKDTTDTRKKAQAAYDKAQTELEALRASRPVAELEALVAGARPVCRIVVANGSRQRAARKRRRGSCRSLHSVLRE